MNWVIFVTLSMIVDWVCIHYFHFSDATQIVIVIFAIILSMTTVALNLACVCDSNVINEIERPWFQQWYMCHVLRKHVFMEVFYYEDVKDQICLLCHRKIKNATKLKKYSDKRGSQSVIKERLEKKAKLNYFNSLSKKDRAERFIEKI